MYNNLHKFALPIPLNYIHLGKSANQAIGTGVATKILLDTVFSGNGLTFNAATNDVTIETDGMYSVSIYNSWANNAVGIRTRFLYLNGVVTYLQLYSAPLGNTVSVMGLCFNTAFQAGNILAMGVSQTSGGALNVVGGIKGSPELTIVKLSDLTP